jgi:hypothetical protein
MNLYEKYLPNILIIQYPSRQDFGNTRLNAQKKQKNRGKMGVFG